MIFHLLDQIFFSKKSSLSVFLPGSPRPIKVSNFIFGWVQYRARRETGDSRAVTPIQFHLYGKMVKIFRQMEQYNSRALSVCMLKKQLFRCGNEWNGSFHW